MLAKLMREGRDIDVWMFITPQEAADALPLLTRKLGRRQGFWDFRSIEAVLISSGV